MNPVLFIRVDRELVEALDRVVREEKERRPGTSISRSDVVRWMLWETVRKRDRERAHPEKP